MLDKVELGPTVSTANTGGGRKMQRLLAKPTDPTYTILALALN